MVVVVQLFATNQQAPGRDVGAGVGGLKVAVAPVVANAVDDAGGKKRNPRHLNCPNGGTQGTKGGNLHDEQQGHALPRVAAVDVALHPVVGGAVAEALHRVGVFGLNAVELGALPHHGANATGLGAVGVVGGFALGVVFAVDADPLARDHAGGKPQPKPKHVRHRGVQIKGPVRLVAVQVNGDAGNRHVRGEQRVHHQLPPRSVK